MRRLIIRRGAIGDCLLSFPALEHVAADYTEIWAPSPILPVIQFASATHSIASTQIDLIGIADVETPEALIARLQSFDSILSWSGSNQSEFRSAMLGVNRNCKFYPALPQDSTLHATDFYAAQVGAPANLIPRIRITPLEPRPKIAVHPFSGSKKKNWPLENYRDLAARLPLEVDWLAGPEEVLAEAHRFENLADLAAFIAGAQLYIGNDSGISHLAAAAGVKTLAIFGPSDPKVWAPRGPNVSVLVGRPLESLSVQMVADAANRLLDSRSS